MSSLKYQLPTTVYTLVNRLYDNIKIGSMRPDNSNIRNEYLSIVNYLYKSMRIATTDEKNNGLAINSSRISSNRFEVRIEGFTASVQYFLLSEWYLSHPHLQSIIFAFYSETLILQFSENVVHKIPVYQPIQVPSISAALGIKLLNTLEEDEIPEQWIDDVKCVVKYVYNILDTSSLADTSDDNMDEVSHTQSIVISFRELYMISFDKLDKLANVISVALSRCTFAQFVIAYPATLKVQLIRSVEAPKFSHIRHHVAYQKGNKVIKKKEEME